MLRRFESQFSRTSNDVFFRQRYGIGNLLRCCIVTKNRESSIQRSPIIERAAAYLAKSRINHKRSLVTVDLGCREPGSESKDFGEAKDHIENRQTRTRCPVSPQRMQ